MQLLLVLHVAIPNTLHEFSPYVDLFVMEIHASEIVGWGCKIGVIIVHLNHSNVCEWRGFYLIWQHCASFSYGLVLVYNVLGVFL